MFTDLVGYSTLMGEDERKVIRLLQKNRELLKSIIKLERLFRPVLRLEFVRHFTDMGRVLICCGSILEREPQKGSRKLQSTQMVFVAVRRINVLRA